MHAANSDLLADLTPAQREAVLHMDGPLLILAGAGSGKTRVITRRVVHLLQQGIRPSNILAITFTNKAAGEMRNRVEAMVPGSPVWISTFHSLGARLLRLYHDRLGLDRNFTIFDQTDRARMVKLAMEDAGLDESRYKPDSLSGAISKAKNQLLSPERYANQARDFFTQTVAKVYPYYEKRMRDASALDFDDLLYWPALALKNNAELRAELDARFRYIMIDEYQDTNLAQYAIVRGLSEDHPNLCVVGDPDQSIYKFRGSDIRNILDFERDFPDAKVLTLSQNYRSTKAILAASSALIGNNRQRKPKDLITDNATGVPVRILLYESGVEEAEGIALRIRQAVEESQGKRCYRDVAIFLRMNALTRGLELAFTKHRIPFQIIKGLAFFDRKENRDVLAYLQLLINPRNELAFERAVNEPARGIGKVSLENLRQFASARQLSLLEAASLAEQIPLLKGKAASALRGFAQIIFALNKLLDIAPDEFIRQVLDRSGYRKALMDSRDEMDQDRLANIEELITAAREYHREDSSRTISDFVENITLASDVDGWDSKADSVSIMTMHSAKGLEFPVVYLMAMEQGILPHERSLGKDEEVEEERRLAFVGMTRAKEELVLTHARLRDFRGQTLYAVPSMFIDELPAEQIERVDLAMGANRNASFDEWRRGGSPAAQVGWNDAGLRPRPEPIKPSVLGLSGSQNCPYTVGMRVRHGTYGDGKVVEVSGQGVLRKVKIRFRTAGERAFIVDKVKLDILG